MKVVVSILFFYLLAMPVMSQCDKQKWQQLAHNVEFVVLAEVEEVKASPGFWSGHIAAIQNVKYKVVTVLKGQLTFSEIEVEYYVVKNSPLADTEEARLSPKIFKSGSQLILFLNHDSASAKSYFHVNVNLGTVKAEEEIMKMLSP